MYTWKYEKEKHQLPEINFTFIVDEKLKDKFEKRADIEQRTIAGQLRFLMEAYVENRMEIKES